MAQGILTSQWIEMAQQAIKKLESLHRNELPEIDRLNSHYEGRQPLSYMHPALVMELGDRMRQVVIHWPALVVDSIEERLDVEGFRLGGAADADDDLQWIWQANGLDGASQRAHVDALVMRRSYAVIGVRTSADTDPASGVDVSVPLITVESPLEMISIADQRTRRVAAAMRVWTTQIDAGPLFSTPWDVDRLTLYLPNSTSHWKRDEKREWALDEDDTVGVDQHNLGVVPVVPIVNRPHTVRPRQQSADGVSDLEPVIPLSDAACKIATDMMVSAEFHSMPRRWSIGVAAEDFVDNNGNPLQAFSQVAGRMWATERGPQEVSFGQFAEADLSNFHNTLNALARMVASVSGLPPHYLGMATDNPASADAIRSSEARLVKRAERKQRALGEAWEQVMRIALLIRDGKVDKGAARMETLWRDASTPTVAQVADAAVKKFQAHLVPRRQSLEDMNYTSLQIERIMAEFQAEAQAAAVAMGLGEQAMPGAPMAPDSSVPRGVIPVEPTADTAVDSAA